MSKKNAFIEKLLSDNPNANKAQVKDVSRVIKEVRSFGVFPQGYDIRPPFSNPNRVKPASENPSVTKLIR